jgi:hypothetical protein
MKYRWVLLLSLFVLISFDIRYATASGPSYVKLFGEASVILMVLSGVGIAATAVFRGLRSAVTKTQVLAMFNCSAIALLCIDGYHRRRGESLVTFSVISLIVLVAFNGTLWNSFNKIKQWKVQA